MATIDHDHVYVDSDELLPFVRRALTANQVSDGNADYVAWHLVETSLRGTDSHGVARLPHYIRRLRGGSIQPRPDIRFEPKGASVGMVDGDHGLGHVVTRRAVDEAARLAASTGAGWVAIRNSSHCGALAPYGLQLAEMGLVAIVFTHADSMVLPHGAREPFCGTNPLCFAAPGADGRALCLDLATSIVPWNLVANAAQEGVAIPQGWAVDRQGADTTNPRDVAGLYPFGQHKGSGLGIMIDVFCALLSGARFGPNIPKMYGDMSERRQLGGLVGAISIAHFADPRDFQGRVAALIAQLGAMSPAAGFDRVLFPGERELETKARRQRDGIPVGVQIFAELNELAATLGLPGLARWRAPSDRA